MSELIITNGDSAGDSLGEAYPDAVVLPWRDVLHEGPVPMTRTIEEFSRIRATYLNETWGVGAEGDFGVRDSLLSNLEGFQRISLWFEHDLYDQLQLLQVLDYVHAAEPPAEVVLVQADDYLGYYSADKITMWQDRRAEVSVPQVALARRAWRAFREETPEAWADLLDADGGDLPYLSASVRRMLEELPDVRTGLSRTERHILEVVDAGYAQPGPMFKAYQECEEALFLGDWSFFNRIDALSDAQEPLLQTSTHMRFEPEDFAQGKRDYLQNTYTLTDFGRAVLHGEEDTAALNSIDFWWGGTHVTNDNLWRWDYVVGVLSAPPS